MKLLVQVASALSYMHEELKIAHNDLKPDNVFAHAGGNINNYDHLNSTYNENLTNSEDDDGVSYYVADFGYTKHAGFKSKKEAKAFFAAKMESYFAPEILALIEDAEDQEREANIHQMKKLELQEEETKDGGIIGKTHDE